jgi:hypothetical protein
MLPLQRGIIASAILGWAGSHPGDFTSPGIQPTVDAFLSSITDDDGAIKAAFLSKIKVIYLYFFRT